jgi:hypothetical protein
MSKVILIVPFAPPEFQQTIQEYVQNRAGWWHYGNDTWLLRFQQPISTEAFRNELRGLIPGMQFLVLQFPDSPNQWNGYGPPEWGKWLNETWNAGR